MSEYDEILEKAREAGEQFMSTAKEFVPRMYEALRNENRNISPYDARDRIEKDCVGIWGKRTILEALPDEAKNKEKQKAGRLRRKGENSAALTAAQTSKRRVLMVSTKGAVEHKEETKALTIVSNNHDNLAQGHRQRTNNEFQAEEGVINKQETAYIQGYSECEELRIKVRDYEEALSHVPLIGADQIVRSNITYRIPKETHHLLENAMLNCSCVYFLTFDPIGNLVSAEPDISYSK